ncbi:hypothetical protein PQR62_08230 [Herbaspirillum lusitanum]|uniref:SPOR domain-containing protein n=1 Tax=Herbaspirillum lusitanum TaxID=213312 RepID=A0ABW9A7D4_9BURK
MKLKLFFWLLLIGNVVVFGLQRGYFGATASERHEPQRLTQQLRPEALAILPPNSEKLVPAARAANPDAVAAAATAGAPAAAPELAAATPTSTPAAPASAATPANAAAPAAKPEPPQQQAGAKVETVACTEVGNFTAPDAKRFSAQLASLNLGNKIQLKTLQDVTSNMVYIAPQDGKDGAERRLAELKRLGIKDFYVIPDTFPNPALRWGISLGIFKTEDAAKAYVGQLIGQGLRSARIIARRSGAGKQAFQLRDMTPANRSALENIKRGFPEQEIRSCEVG